jgi:hypothetical protein
MRTKIAAYFAAGFLFQLLIVCNIAYLYTLLSAHKADEALRLYAANFPGFLQDKIILLLVGAGMAVISMLCYSAARKLSVNKGFRNVVMGLILVDAIVLLLLLFALL